jgi:O-antigen/teichoic acid export membrane protein
MLSLAFDWEKCKQMLAFSIPLVFSGAGVFVLMYADRIAVRQLLSLSALGIYAVGYRLASVVTLSMVGSQMALTPLIYQHFDLPETPFQIARIFRWVLALALPLILFMSAFSREAVSLLATPHYGAASRVVFPLAVAFLFSNLYIFAPGAWIAKKTTTIALINVGAAVVGIALNWVLIPVFGLLGAAFANGAAAAAAFAAYVVVGQRSYPIPYAWKRVSAAVILVVLFGATMHWILGAVIGAPLRTSVVSRGIAWSLVSVAIVLVVLGRTEIGSGIQMVMASARSRFGNRQASF